MVRARQLLGDLVELIPPANLVKQGVRCELCLQLDIEPSEHKRRRVSVAAEIVNANFRRVGGGLAQYSMYPNAVSALRLELDSVEACYHVRVQIALASDFVQKLSGDRVNRDEPARVLVFGDHEGAVIVHFGDGEARVSEVRDFLEKGIVAACRLSSTFEDVAGNHR